MVRVVVRISDERLALCVPYTVGGLDFDSMVRSLHALSAEWSLFLVPRR